MISVRVAATVFSAGFLALQQAPAGPLKALHEPREVHLSNVRQLTFEGQNAEAYWSPDGTQLVFQARSGAMKSDQIYTMKADGSDKKMVSTGKGACTCAYFLPGNKEIIFSSTHGFDPGDPPQPDRSKGYTWPLHNFAIYRANADGSNLRPLYPKKVEPGVRCGYNAESTLSPDGKRIVFTSDREGDLELYTMKTDGTDVKRITQRIGYDGGAFFSPDSKRIVWRAYQPKNDAEKEEYLSLLKEGLVRPSKMEIWVANADGSDARQVTANGAANFAPFFTPDGKRIIFCSNFEDPRGRKFELYLIGIEGKETERVTYGNEFDGFPMFSPDGKRFVWASNRNGKAPRDTNIFCADWVP